ncbi:Uncharacterised protein [Acinetobacter baumannii]|uniref:EpsG family protein n=1 Tax=Acinetobacter baumannii TaxID=470 RepID=UPI000DE66F51|nr:EpsG family protein [Acinetobacter baumannii]MCJ9026377.1 EpsG family protein [Acinetobacter baumannii]MCJ9063655.1 EpsG family protein [Acinetobacter baumannii]MCJ9096060.1 EpsG family protein [Acinetobacter baumannii]MCJ9110629.1 EpsG family protein [Acinetobacter baumannii]MCJ9129078.1 EpsG family protein [Acinetobacter baumannii]
MNTSEFRLLNKMLIWLFGLIYFFLTLNLDNNLFRDREAYLYYAAHSDIIYDLYNGYAIYFNEPVFLKLNIFLNSFFSDEQIVYLLCGFVVFFTVFFICYFSKNILSFWLGLLILFFSYYLFHFQFVIIRQALATIIFLFFLIFNKRYSVNIFVAFFMSFIHSAFFLIAFIYMLYCILELRKIKYTKISYFFLIFSAVLGVLITKVALLLGVRQAEEDHLKAGVSVGGGAFLLFSFIFCYLLFFYEGVKDHLFKVTLVFLGCFLGFYFFTPISGRLMSSFLLLILLILVRENNIKSIVVLFILSLIFILMAFQGNVEMMSLEVPYEEVLNKFFSLRLL